MTIRRWSRVLLAALCVGVLVEGCSLGRMRRGQGTDMVLPEPPRETLIGAVRRNCPDSTVVGGRTRAGAACTRAIDTLPDPSPIPGQKTP